MKDDLFRRIALYHATMSVFSKLQNIGLISADEIARIDDNVAEKYGLKSSVIYRRKP